MVRRTFGQLLREQRAQRNLTQDDVAKLIGLRRTKVSDMENETVPAPKYDILLKLIKLWKLDPLDTLECCAYTLRYLRTVNG